MELRPAAPPPAPGAPPDRLARALLGTLVVAVAALAAVLWFGGRERPPEASIEREVASRLLAAGLVEEAAERYRSHFATVAGAPGRAEIAYSVGEALLERGDPAAALEWFYDAESAGAGELSNELSADLDRKIVRALEALGRGNAARAALAERAAPADPEASAPAGEDPVVARLGERQVRRSEVERWLDDLPPEVAAAFDRTGGRGAALERYVAEEALWQKALRLEYDRDPEVRRRHERLLRQLAVARMVEREVVDRVEIDPADLETFFAARSERYRQPGAGANEPLPELDQVRSAVERDYRRYKIEAAWQRMVEQELEAGAVVLLPEGMGDAD